MTKNKVGRPKVGKKEAKRSHTVSLSVQRAIDLKKKYGSLTLALNTVQINPTYEDYLKVLIPPVKLVYNNDEWIMTENKGGEYTLIPCRKITNKGESIKVPHGTIFTHIMNIYNEDL